MDEFKKSSYPYPIFASIEGNIGSGKSTLLSNLKNHFKNDNRIVFI